MLEGSFVVQEQLKDLSVIHAVALVTCFVHYEKYVQHSSLCRNVSTGE